MKYAIIQTGSKQYKVKEGDQILVEKLDMKEEGKPSFTDVLLLKTDKETIIGRPKVKNAVVLGKIMNHTKGEKVRVATYKAKSRYRRVKGHRQVKTKVLIEKISTQGKTATKAQR